MLEHKKETHLVEWLSEVVSKAELADYSPVSGCMILRPVGYAIWEKIQNRLDSEFKARNVKNTYFPLFIPESLLKKEATHFAGFVPEVAWVTYGGEHALNERLAIRPTSETVMYESFARWIRSWRDLPLKINQWCNIVRCEFKHPQPFLRTREFLWQEGHTAYATREEAEKEARDILLNVYAKAYVDLLAVPVTAGRKSEKEKFAGADYTLTLEILMPDGKVIQGCTSHHLGQRFAKVFGIKFLDRDERKKLVWQNSWGFTTRSIGITVAIHSDNKGLVLPPKIAPTQIVIIPIYKTKEKETVLRESRKVKAALEKGFSVALDDREGYTPGWKFNEWELKGIPLRIEIGPKDIKAKRVIFARRDTGERKEVKRKALLSSVKKELEDIQNNLFKKASDFVRKHTKKAKNFAELEKLVKGNRVKTVWCSNRVCEDKIKEKTGAIISCIVPEKAAGKCVVCGKKAAHTIFVARSY